MDTIKNFALSHGAAPHVHYTTLIWRTHILGFIQILSFFSLIIIGLNILHVLLFQSIFIDFSFLILKNIERLTLIVLFVALIYHTSRTFLQLHSRWNISLFHTLPINQFLKFFILFFFVFVIQPALLFLFFLGIGFCDIIIYSFVDSSIDIKIFFAQDDFWSFQNCEVSVLINCYAIISVFFFGSIYFRSKHIIKTLFLILSVDIVFSILLHAVLKITLHEDMQDIIAILIIILGVLLSYVLMKKHTIIKVK